MNDEPQKPLEPEIVSGPIFDGNVRPMPYGEAREPGPHFAAPPAPRRPKRRLPLILFLLTCASTLYAGMAFPGVIDETTGKVVDLSEINPATYQGTLRLYWPRTLLNGFTYAAAVLTVLGAHEMGHYLQARRYGVPVTLPLFIPMIPPLGTMGAVIVQQPGVADRKSMFDIAITGPLAGLVVALPLNWWGIVHSKIGPLPPGSTGYTNPRIVEWMVAWIHRPLQPGEDIVLNPILFAGWVGILVTALNLIPIGQLDGGHILYCLIGRKAHRVALLLYVCAIGLVIYQMLSHRQPGWILMVFLIFLMGTRHPPTANDHVPLGKTRIILGWLTLAFILIGFISAPMYQTPVKRPAPESATVSRTV
jgi:membrane-associated protease RseP (regulator of RpoE activity)